MEGVAARSDLYILAELISILRLLSPKNMLFEVGDRVHGSRWLPAGLQLRPFRNVISRRTSYPLDIGNSHSTDRRANVRQSSVCDYDTITPVVRQSKVPPGRTPDSF